MDEDLYSLLGQIDPELAQKMVNAGLAPQRMGLAGQQRDLAHEQYDTPSAQGRNVGQAYVASSPLEHLSVAMRRYQGAKGMNAAQDLQSNIVNQRGQDMGSGWSAILNAMRQRGAQQPQAPIQPMSPGFAPSEM